MELNKIKLINSELEKYLECKYPSIIYESMKYSIFSGGKRIRPLIMLGVHEFFGGNEKEILPFAIAMEMIHTYSLIHDDLPAMDDDDLRRGNPTNHIKFGEAIAILAGDGLLNLAYEIIFDNCKNENSIKVGREISKCAGTSGMIGGQVVDIISEAKEISENDLEYIHLNKTGKLLKASFTSSGLLLGLNQTIINKLSIIGFNYGKAFQILDDILDIESTSEILGKPIGSDVKNNKTTFVSIHGIDCAKIVYNNLKIEVLNDLSEITNKNSYIYKLIEKSFNRIK